MPFRKTKPKDVQFLVGRDDQLRFFRDMILRPEDPSHNILSISGQGGVGKSTLLQRFLGELHLAEYQEYCLSALANERQTTPASAMERFADQLREQGHPLKKFEDALTRYKEAVRRIQVAYRDEQELLVRDVVDVVGSVVEEIPFAGGIFHKGTMALTDHVLEQGRMRQFLKDAARLEDPVTDLTGTFVKDLNQLADTFVATSGTWNRRSRRILLFFDTFEQLAPDIAPWLLDHFLELEVSPNIVLVIAGRDSIELSLPDDPKRWLPLLDSGTIHLLSLNVFTEEETRIYLKKRGITDAEQMRQIRQLSRGLPLYLSMLTANPEGEGHIDPTAGVVENFLRWIPKHEAQKRQLALNASLFSLPFTKDDIAVFFDAEPERSDLYYWLIGQPFIQHSQQEGGYHYHDIARDLFRRYLYQHSREDYYTARRALAHHYQRRLEVLQAEGSKSVYTSRSWKELVFALIQQVFLLPDKESHLPGIEYVLRMHEHNWQDNALIRTLNSLCSDEPEHQVTTHAQSTAKLLLQYIELDPEEHYQQWVAASNALLENISHIPTFPSDVIAYLYRHKGRACRLVKDYQNALVHFNYALTLLPNYAAIYNGRGQTYRLMERYQEALTDFDKALFLDENYTWALASRGQTYRQMKRYDEALTNFDKALALVDTNSWLFAQRGETYRQMKRYDEALTNFDKALALNENYTWVLGRRGQTYLLVKRYEEALTDFDRAIALDENDDWKRYDKAILYLLKNQMVLFHDTIHVALDIARSQIEGLTRQDEEYYRLRFNAALYLLVGGLTEEAEADYLQLLSTCSIASRLQAAATDLEEFFTLQTANEFAQHMLTLVKKRIEEVG